MPKNEPFNGLTPAQAERLAMLAEEAGEIVHAVGKVLRHGYGSKHPSDYAVKFPQYTHHQRQSAAKTEESSTWRTDFHEVSLVGMAPGESYSFGNGSGTCKSCKWFITLDKNSGECKLATDLLGRSIQVLTSTTCEHYTVDVVATRAPIT